MKIGGDKHKYTWVRLGVKKFVVRRLKDYKHVSNRFKVRVLDVIVLKAIAVVYLDHHLVGGKLLVKQVKSLPRRKKKNTGRL